MGKKKEEEVTEEVADGGGKKKLIIIIAAVALIVIIGGGAAAFLLLKGGHEEDPAAADGHAPAADAHGAKDTKKAASSGAHAGEMGPVFMVKDMVINLVSEGGSRFCKVGIGLELDNPKMEHEMTKREALIKDVMITVISKKTPEELMTPKGQDSIKQEIMDAINDTLKDGRITKVYFTMFLIQ
ncbi:MAG: flagellar biosynthesis protein FliL [Pseudomonadota bacterium]|jgi:flagellar FliL protein